MSLALTQAREQGEHGGPPWTLLLLDNLVVDLSDSGEEQVE
jgi:hypothetical protein